MSLSNVQYYFKNKDALLKAMADRYFYRCLEDIEGERFIATVYEFEQIVIELKAKVLEGGNVDHGVVCFVVCILVGQQVNHGR